MANNTVSLLGAQALGVAKLKGHIERDPFGDVTLNLSEEEKTLFSESISPSERKAAKPRALDANQLEDFLDKWGADLEGAALESAIETLGRASVEKVRAFLADDDIPREYLDALNGFCVEDFDGLEDITVTGSEVVTANSFRLDYYFDVGALIWTVEMDEIFAAENAQGLAEHFFNSRSEDGIAKMEAYQRRYFRGSAIFHQHAEAFTDPVITLSALKPKRKNMRIPAASDASNGE